MSGKPSIQSIFLLAVMGLLGAAAAEADPGDVYARGQNTQGMLGVGDQSDRSQPVRVMRGVTDVSAGSFHTLFHGADGSVWGAGENIRSQLGTENNRETVPVQLVDEAIWVSGGGLQSFYVDPEGRLFGIGTNEYGELGTGDTAKRDSFTEVATGVRSVSAGRFHTLFVTEDDELFAMGRNHEPNRPDTPQGALGTGDGQNRSSPVKIASDVEKAFAGVGFSLYLKKDGSLWGMGWGSAFGVVDNKLTPERIDTGVVDATTGGSAFFLYRKENGETWGSGWNRQGQLFRPGNAAEKPAFSDTGVIGFAAGDFFSLWLMESPEGQVLGAGGNSYDQMGARADTIGRTVVTDGVGDVFAVAAGDWSSFYLTNPSFSLPGYGTVEAVRGRVFSSPWLGEIAFRVASQLEASVPAGVDDDYFAAFSRSLGALVRTDGATVASPQYGALSSLEGTVGPRWVESDFFGTVHFGEDGDEYGGYVSSERFGWMKFEGASYFWVPDLSTWMKVQPDGSFYSHDFRELVPTSMTTYRSPILGNVTVGDYNGWVASDRFGWVWAARGSGGVWFWSQGRGEWLGVTEDGGIWSTAERRFLP